MSEHAHTPDSAVPHTVGIIEARMGSTRLPGKVLRQAVGRPLLGILAERLAMARSLTDVVIATTTEANDGAIASWASRARVACFRGSEVDVLGRVLGAARSVGADIIVEVTGDCPLLDPATVDKAVRAYHEAGCDFVSNRLTAPSYPDGFGVRVFSTDLLHRVSALTTEPRDREHVSVYMWEHPELFSLHHVASDLDREHQDYRLTLDTEADLKLISAILEVLYPADRAFTLADVLELLNSRPEIRALHERARDDAVAGTAQ